MEKDESNFCELGCGCGTSHHNNEPKQEQKKTVKAVLFYVGVFLGILALLLSDAKAITPAFIAITFPSVVITLPLFLISYAFVGWDIFRKAYQNIQKGLWFDENFLMTIATLGAFVIGEYAEGIAVILFYRAGEFFQELAIRRSKRSISDLMHIQASTATVKRGEDLIEEEPENVRVGECILVKPGERIPLDGVILEGTSTLDSSALTGESIPVFVEKGDEVFSGQVNQKGSLWVEVQKPYVDSTVSKILQLVESSHQKKAKMNRFITTFSSVYTPMVCVFAIFISILSPFFLKDVSWVDGLYRGLIFLVVSCPCGLVISIPLSFIGGIGGASRNGILIKGDRYLEALTKVETIVFDKTGTITNGQFEVMDIQAVSDLTKDDVLEISAKVESFSTHPLAISVVKYYDREVNVKNVQNHWEKPGFGAGALIEGKQVIIGNRRLMEESHISIPAHESSGTILYLAVEGVYKGSLMLKDQIKENTEQVIQNLRFMGVRQLIMLSGDADERVHEVGKTLKLDAFFGKLLPQNKVEKLDEILQNKTPNKIVVFVGDGINDAPVLVAADIGIAMGGLGSHAAIEAADVVLMDDRLDKLQKAIHIAQFTKSVVWQNIVVSLGVKALVLYLATLGVANMWMAVFADVGVAFLAILNAARVILKKYP